MLRLIVIAGLLFPASSLGQEFLPVFIEGDPNVSGDAAAESGDDNISTIEVNIAAPGGDTLVEAEIGRDGIVTYQGDMILGTAKHVTTNSNPVPFGVGSKRPEARWPNATLRYLKLTNSASLVKIKKAISAWEKTGVVKFEEITTPSGDYVEFVQSSNVCRSSLGRTGGRQLIQLSSGCSATSIAHEIAHAFGLMHEQVRDDRDSYVKYNAQNVVEGKQVNFATNPALFEDLGHYCYESLMHYPGDMFSKNGEPTLEIKSEGLKLPHHGNVIGQRSQISSCDIESMARLYQ